MKLLTLAVAALLSESSLAAVANRNALRSGQSCKIGGTFSTYRDASTCNVYTVGSCTKNNPSNSADKTCGSDPPQTFKSDNYITWFDENKAIEEVK